jgi:hypothetical protein
MTFAGLHDAVEAGPMARLEIGRNDQIEGASDGLICREAENATGAGIPEIDDSGPVGRYDRVGRRIKQRLDKTGSGRHGTSSCLSPAAPQPLGCPRLCKGASSTPQRLRSGTCAYTGSNQSDLILQMHPGHGRCSPGPSNCLVSLFNLQTRNIGRLVQKNRYMKRKEPDGRAPARRVSLPGQTSKCVCDDYPTSFARGGFEVFLPALTFGLAIRCMISSALPNTSRSHSSG